MKIIRDRHARRFGAECQIVVVFAWQALIKGMLQCLADDTAQGFFDHLVVSHQIIGHGIAIEARSGAWVNGAT